MPDINFEEIAERALFLVENGQREAAVTLIRETLQQDSQFEYSVQFIAIASVIGSYLFGYELRESPRERYLITRSWL
jgi:hypothetical protein